MPEDVNELRQYSKHYFPGKRTDAAHRIVGSAPGIDRREILKSFFDQMRKSRELDNQVCHLGDVIREYNVNFIHSVSNYTGEWRSSIINLLVNPNCVISSSTLKKGDTILNITLARTIGVLLGSNNIIDRANPEDTGSVVQKNGERSNEFGQNESRDISLRDQIKGAIEGRREDNHNEIYLRPVSKGETIDVFGLWVCNEPSIESVEKTRPSFERLKEFVDQTHIPIYVIENGEVYEGKFDFESYTIKRNGGVILPSDLIKRKFSLDSGVKNSLIEELRHDFSLFNIRTQDWVTLLLSYNIGERMGRAENQNEFNNPQQVFMVAKSKAMTRQTAIELYRYAETILDQTGLDYFLVTAKDLVGDVLPFEAYLKFKSHYSSDGRFVLSRQEIDEYFETGNVDLFK